jgi:NAD(P)-dependent dehydrogenase (short-subunit alcohol dehydrogenase family)
MDLGLHNATVVVAGGTTGMGRAAAECFAEDGARVAVLARSKAGLDETTDALTALGSPDAVGIPTDLFDTSSVTAAMDEVGGRWGHLNALVNAGGPMHGALKTFETYNDDEWLDVFDGLTLAAVRTVRAALPLLRKAEWARIVNVSAMSTKHQSPPLIAYTAAKSALTSLTKNLSQSLAPDGILVNTVSPGTFASESFKAALAAMPEVDENDLRDIMRFIKEGFGHHVFLDRAADPSEIGPVIAFAASARNTYMTGANLNVDGGSDFT